MTWYTDDRQLYWEQRRLDMQADDARRSMLKKAQDSLAATQALIAGAKSSERARWIALERELKVKVEKLKEPIGPL